MSIWTVSVLGRFVGGAAELELFAGWPEASSPRAAHKGSRPGRTPDDGTRPKRSGMTRRETAVVRSGSSLMPGDDRHLSSRGCDRSRLLGRGAPLQARCRLSGATLDVNEIGLRISPMAFRVLEA